MTPALRARRGRSAAFAVVGCLLVASGCHRQGGTPTSPSPPVVDLSRTDTPLELSPQRHLLQLIGNDLSDDPATPACSPILVPRGGKFVTTFLWFEWHGDELVGRSRPPYAATMEIRLRRVSSSILGVVVSGTVTGAAPDEYDLLWGTRDTAFVAAGETLLSGLVSPHVRDDAIGPIVSGWMRGVIEFRDTTGALSRCSNVHYSLQPAPPGGPHDDPTVPPLVPAPFP